MIQVLCRLEAYRIWGVSTEEMHSLKAVSYVLFGDLTEDYSPGDRLSEL